MSGPGVAVLIALDGVVHVSDLPIQSFARHITEQLPADRGRAVIAGMRGFLERRVELIPPGSAIKDAEDGYQAVEILARAAGLTAAEISVAHRASREDLAGSAWAVDPADGLDDLLTLLAGRATVAVAVQPGDPAGRAMLDELGLSGGPALIESNTGDAVRNVLLTGNPTDPRRLLVIGTRWHDQLDAAAGAGCTTAMIDRYDKGIGQPNWRAGTLADLLDPIGTWLESTQGVSR